MQEHVYAVSIRTDLSLNNISVRKRTACLILYFISRYEFKAELSVVDLQAAHSNVISLLNESMLLNKMIM